MPSDLASVVFQVLGSMLLGLSVGGGVLGCSASGWWAMPAICLFLISLWLLSGDVSIGRKEA